MNIDMVTNKVYDTVEVPREEYNILLMSQARLDDIRLIVASDPRQYTHLDERTENAVEALLGIERKEKTA